MKMVEITLYFDVWPSGNDFKNLFAYSNPTKKLEGLKRYSVTFSIPDPNQPDVEISTEAKEVE